MEWTELIVTLQNIESAIVQVGWLVTMGLAGVAISLWRRRRR